MNGYIPDPTNIGTTFVNGISNMLTTAALDVKLNLGEEARAAQAEALIGDYTVLQDGTLALGSVRLGQSIDLLFKMNSSLDSINGGSLSYEQGDQKFEVPISGLAVQKCSNDDMQPHLLRFETIKLLQHLIA
jgi:hypothetical protein